MELKLTQLQYNPALREFPHRRVDKPGLSCLFEHVRGVQVLKQTNCST